MKTEVHESSLLVPPMSLFLLSGVKDSWSRRCPFYALVWFSR
jgi:hypothetical protein